MGAAAYRRGSRLIREQIDRELQERRERRVMVSTKEAKLRALVQECAEILERRAVAAERDGDEMMRGYSDISYVPADDRWTIGYRRGASTGYATAANALRDLLREKLDGPE